MNESKSNVEEKIITPKQGIPVLLGTILLLLLSLGGIILSALSLSNGSSIAGGTGLTISILIMILSPILFAGLKVVNPNEAIVFLLFGKYYGTINKAGFYFINPFCCAFNPTVKSFISVAAGASGTNTTLNNNTGNKKISLKVSTLNNEKQKVNDELGNPIVIGVIVIWKVVNTTKAVFQVNNYKTYLSIQCDSVIRNVARCYPYDTAEGSDEKSLRGSSQEVADIMKEELQSKMDIAGLEIVEVKITHLSYAPEIASAMLQRQQAVAIIDARQKIVEGAVGMVEMALTKLNENDVVQLDEERKAAMVSNLLVVLCGNKDAQPIVNSGSIY